MIIFDTHLFNTSSNMSTTAGNANVTSDRVTALERRLDELRVADLEASIALAEEKIKDKTARSQAAAASRAKKDARNKEQAQAKADAQAALDRETREREQRNPNYKIMLCESFAHDGSCTYGKRCHFAHGPKELRKSTKPCANFMLGHCSWGDKCRWSHPERDERDERDEHHESEYDESECGDTY